jgi:hypothetical protein
VLVETTQLDTEQGLVGDDWRVRRNKHTADGERRARSRPDVTRTVVTYTRN